MASGVADIGVIGSLTCYCHLNAMISILRSDSDALMQKERTITDITGTTYRNCQQIYQTINGHMMMTRGYLAETLCL